MERKHFARDLFLKTLTNMGIKYEIDDGQIIWFDYQGMGFDAEGIISVMRISISSVKWRRLKR